MARSCTAMLALSISCYAYPQKQGAQPGAAGDAQIARAVGTIKSTQADSLTVAPDAGGEVTVKLATSTKILRVPPGEKDLKNATPLQAQDLQPGDRVLVRGEASADGHSIAALGVIVMKQADVSAKQERDREDWQKRGIGGLVGAVDTGTGTITISSAGLGGNHNVIIHTTKTTTARRYAPDSVKFDDARPAALDQVKPGDQLRARGARNADGSELTADEIVFGTFRNIAGTITAIDPSSNSMTVQDAIGNGSVVVQLSIYSQMKKLPQEIAQRIALRLKDGNGASAGESTSPAPVADASPTGSVSRSPRGSSGMQGDRGNGVPDLQRVLGRIPDSKLADLQKGDAVMIVSTLEGDSGAVTAITVLAGVEPILTAAPNRSAAMMLSPWTLSGSGGEAEAAP
jgi:hypothetical protein